MAAFEKIIIPSFHQDVANSAFLSIAFNVFFRLSDLYLTKVMETFI